VVKARYFLYHHGRGVADLAGPGCNLLLLACFAPWQIMAVRVGFEPTWLIENTELVDFAFL
jgi:hypothetical protein